MGIKNKVVKYVGKAGDAVAKAASLSPEQVEQVEAQRNAYLSQMPDPADVAAVELTQRLLAVAGVEIHNAYLPQISQLYTPIDASAEVGSFDAEHNIRFVEITKWVVDKEEESLEKLVNVYDVLSDDDCNIALVFNRTKTTTHVYLAAVDITNSKNNLNSNNYINRLVAAIKGNFPGSQISDFSAGKIPALSNIKNVSVAAVSNVPTKKSEKFNSQTIEKILDGVVPRNRSEEYSVVLLATPVRDIEQRKLHLSELYTALAPYAGWETNFTYTEAGSLSSSSTVGVNAGVSAGRQQGNNSGVSLNESTSDSSNDSQTDSTSINTSDSSSSTSSTTEGTSSSHQDGTSNSVGESISTGVNAGVSQNVNVGMSAGLSATQGQSHSDTTGSSHSQTTGNTAGHSEGNSIGQAVAHSLGKAVSKGATRTTGLFESINIGANFGASFSRSSSVTATIGKNEGITQSFTNYTIKHALEILENQAKRYDQASALGMWDFAAYVLSEDVNVANNVAHFYLALTQGEESYTTQSAVNVWRGDLGSASGPAYTICEYLSDLRHPVFGLTPSLIESNKDFAVYPNAITPTTSLTGKELSYSLNFPRRSVPGLAVIECAGFGRNISKYESAPDANDALLPLGHIYHMHHQESQQVQLSANSLASHTFVSGSTGSGKTNTVCKILDGAIEEGIKFLVIEPAKGEYKKIYGGLDGVHVFATNPAIAPLLKINPFSFPREVHILEHLDRLVEIFNVCWPMYAAMPAVLKSAIEASYEDCGWNLTESTNEYSESYYPSFSDVALNVKRILDSSEYDSENKGAYKGSLLTRLESLTNGLNGLILNEDEIPNGVLFDENTIVDLSRVGSTETKSLFMGLLVLKLQEYRMSQARGFNSSLRHLTVLEEAHNLLKKTRATSSESSGLAEKSVEMITAAIAEMRSFGEGFVIADQAPGLLDEAVIRNTNTKIIMRLPDFDDRNLVGKAAGLSDNQIFELSKLPQGVGAVYQNDWIEPVLCKISKSDTNTPFLYKRPKSMSASIDLNCALDIADMVRLKEPLTNDQLEEVSSMLSSMPIKSSVKASILRCLKSLSELSNVCDSCSFISALFPQLYQVVVQEYGVSHKIENLTNKVAEEAMRIGFIGREPELYAFIIQAVITQYVWCEKHDEAKIKEWNYLGIS